MMLTTVLFSLPVDAQKYIHLLGKRHNVLYIWWIIICVTFEHMDKTQDNRTVTF